jgi:PhnB protein
MAKKTSTRKSTTKKARTTRKTPTRTNGARTTARQPYNTLTTFLVVNDATRALDWYKKAFGAKELTRMPSPGGKIMHAELQIGDTRFMLSDVFPGSDMRDPTDLGATTAGIHVYTKDVDKVWKKAVSAGATVTMPLENQFWGDRYGKLRDPFGHSWSLAYPAKMTEAEKRRKQEEAMRNFAQAERTGMAIDAQ